MELTTGSLDNGREINLINFHYSRSLCFCLLPLTFSLFICLWFPCPFTIYLYFLSSLPSPLFLLWISLKLSSRMSEEMWHHLFSWSYRLILLLILANMFFSFSLLFQKTSNLPVLLLDRGEWYFMETASDSKLRAFWKNDDFYKSTSRQ